MQRELDSNLQLHTKLMDVAKDARVHLEKNPHPDTHALPHDYHAVERAPLSRGN
jgi:hypothetical protein